MIAASIKKKPPAEAAQPTDPWQLGARAWQHRLGRLRAHQDAIWTSWRCHSVIVEPAHTGTLQNDDRGTAVRGRGLTRGGYNEQVRGHVLNARAVQ
jgi:hypothetical protein